MDNDKSIIFIERMQQAIESKAKVEERWLDLSAIIEPKVAEYLMDANGDLIQKVHANKLKKIYDTKNGLENKFKFEVKLDILNIKDLSDDDSDSLITFNKTLNWQLKNIQNSHAYKTIRELKNLYGVAFCLMDTKKSISKIKGSTYQQPILTPINCWDIYINNDSNKEITWANIIKKVNLYTLLSSEEFKSQIPKTQIGKVLKSIKEYIEEYKQAKELDDKKQQLTNWNTQDEDYYKSLNERLMTLFMRDAFEFNISDPDYFTCAEYSQEYVLKENKVHINHFLGSNFLFTVETNWNKIPIIAMYDEESHFNPYGYSQLMYSLDLDEAYNEVLSLSIEQSKMQKPTTLISNKLGLSEKHMEMVAKLPGSTILVENLETERPLQNQIAQIEKRPYGSENIGVATEIAEQLDNNSGQNKQQLSGNFGSSTTTGATNLMLQASEVRLTNRIEEYKQFLSKVAAGMIHHYQTHEGSEDYFLEYKEYNPNSNITMATQKVKKDFFKNDFIINIEKTIADDNWEAKKEKLSGIIQLMSANTPDSAKFRNLLTPQEIVDLLDMPKKYEIIARLNLQNEEETFVKANEIVHLITKTIQINSSAMGSGAPQPPISAQQLIKTVAQIIRDQIPNEMIEEQLNEMQAQQQPNPQQDASNNQPQSPGAPGTFQQGGNQ